MDARRFAALLMLALPSPTLIAAPHAHEHGAVRLDVAVDGVGLSIGVESALHDLLGFERAPRDEKERRAADDLLRRVRSGDGLFGTDPAAQCTLARAEVHAPVLEPGAKGEAPRAGAKVAPADQHADLRASLQYRCAQPQMLRALDVGLFDAFGRIRRIEVQVAGPRGQSKLTLRRPARSVPLQK